MKGALHLHLSFLTALLVLSPFVLQITTLQKLLAALIFLMGILLGALTPDIDKGTDAAIRHASIPSAKGKRFILTPIFGFFITYLCYRPIRTLFHALFGDKIYAKKGHRELPHSPIGILLISILLTFWIELICYALSYIPILTNLRHHPLIPLFGLSFLTGCALHLLEDTCDYSGIHYFYPLSFKRLRGKLRGDGREIRPRIYATLLIIAATSIFLASCFKLLPYSPHYASAVSLGTTILLWLLFLILSGVPAKK